MTAPDKLGRDGFKFGSTFFFFFAIYGIASPYLPIILRKIGYSPVYVGILLGFFELIGIAGPIFLARKADAIGRFNPFLFGSGLAILAGSFLLVGFTSPIGTMLSLSLISLGLKTPVPVIDSSMMKIIENARSEGRKAPNYGILRGFGSVGFILVTLIVQSIPGFDGMPPLVMSLAMAGLALVFFVALFWLPETGSGERATKNASKNYSWIDSTFLIGLAVIALGRLSMSSINSFFSLYMIETLDWHAIGSMSALAVIVEIPMMMAAWRFMRKRSPMEAIAIASAAIVARLLVYALFPSHIGVIVAQLLHSLCYGLFQPASLAFVNLKTPPSERTTGMALLMGLGMGLPAFLGSAFGGLIVEAVGYRWLFALFSVFALLSLALYRANAASLKAVR